METIDRYRRSLKRKNYAAHTVKASMNVPAQCTVSCASVVRNEGGAYGDHLFGKRLSARTIISHVQMVRLFSGCRIHEEGMTNPITTIAIRLPDEGANLPITNVRAMAKKGELDGDYR